ncbi:uncharacterized protein [Engystomops pustulosus]|uniref:uncharacterized protein n=1 Tax=Engystomops pustulosus TaxID=76066 RepID=UPI003AFB681C
MIINMNTGSIDKDIDKDRATLLYNEKYTPQIPTPPPPPPPILTLSESSRSLFQKCDQKRSSRLRNFNWDAIPMERVKGRTSLWSSQTFQGDLQIDTGKMEELFGKQEVEVLPKPCYRRRSISIGDACLNKVFLLDSRRSMNIGIFLKQFKRSATEIVEDIRLGRGDIYSSERLNELLKHLPDREEVHRLKSFQGDRERLSEADLFMMLLMDLPCYCLRLEALILKKDFYPAVLSQLSAAKDLTSAAEELLQCTELHFILKLVLNAGNFMNAGGYAGNAAGFRVSSLLKLADTKANKPGMNLLHFVVMEVQKKDPRYLSFADRLQHVHSASKLSEDGLLEEFDRLQSRITSIHQTLTAPELQELRIQMEEFLEYADHQLQEVQKELDALQVSRHNLCEFLCEDEDMFHLEECCKVFSCFCQKFQLAIKENKQREQEEERRKEWEKTRLQKRHSMATCSALEASQSKDELELTLERNLRNSRRPLGRRVCRMRSLGWNSAKPSISYNDWSEEHCDQKTADQMRKVSERVLMQQMEFKGHKNVKTESNNRNDQLLVAKNCISCRSEAKVDTQKVSLLVAKEKTEIFQLSPETYESSGQQLDKNMSAHLAVQQHVLCDRTQLQDISELLENSLQPSDLKSDKSSDTLRNSRIHPSDKNSVVPEVSKQSSDGENIQMSSQYCTTTSPQESTLLTEPKCTAQLLIKPMPVHSDTLKVQVSKQIIENERHKSDFQALDQSYLQRQLCLTDPKTLTFSERLVGHEIHEVNKKSVMQYTSEPSMQAVAQGKSHTPSKSNESSGNKPRNETSLQVLDHIESENLEQLSDLHATTSSKQTNRLVSESTNTPKTTKTITQVTAKAIKQTSVKSSVRDTRHSVALPVSQSSSPSTIPRFETLNQNHIANKSETPKLRRSQPGCFMSKIKQMEPLPVRQSPIPREMNDHILPTKEKNEDLQNESSRGLQYMESNSISKSVKDVHPVVQKETHNPCSKWKRELRNTSEKANSVRPEPILENNTGSNKNTLELKSGDTIKNSLLGRNGRSIPKKSKTNDLGIRRVPLTKDLAMGSVGPSVIKQPNVSFRQKDSKDSKIPQKISLSTAGAGKSTQGKTTGTFREKEASNVNNNDYGKSESNRSPSTNSRTTVPSTLKVEVWSSQVSPKKSNSVPRVAVHVIKHYEVNTTLTRGTRNTYTDSHPIWR